MSFNSNFNFDLKSRFKAIISQPNVIFGILSLFCFLVIIFLGTCVIKEHSHFSLLFMGLIIFGLMVLGAVLILKSDMTESIELQQGDNKLIIRSPSRQLMLSIIRKLLENTARPDKLIPIDIDPKDDPSKFNSLTEEQQEAIVKKEIEVALSGKADK